MVRTHNLKLLFGTNQPTDEQRRVAKGIVDGTPFGPTPLDIALSFITRNPPIDPKAISQWPRNESWNPLIVEFFNSTDMQPSNDMTPWCAAFVNWCIEHNKTDSTHKKGSHSASSQSFLTNKLFEKVANPKVGDLAVFTCYDKTTGKSLDLGHVGFVHREPAHGKVDVLGGNQLKDGMSMISSKIFETGAVETARKINGKSVACMMRLNSYVRSVQ